MDRQNFLKYLEHNSGKVIFSYKGEVSGEIEYFVARGVREESEIEGTMVCLAPIHSIHLDALLEKEDLKIINAEDFKSVGNLDKEEQ